MHGKKFWLKRLPEKGTGYDVPDSSLQITCNYECTEQRPEGTIK
jgi:hypothetical protein